MASIIGLGLSDASPSDPSYVPRNDSGTPDNPQRAASNKLKLPGKGANEYSKDEYAITIDKDSWSSVNRKLQ
ncbi:hypothetical protein TWF481_002749 [Arthrobotrys musiformis]|uniref:Uncharacterized protein n=1 Tax=Arthrobotrys musiformis TaxID=47236 RepID=A0AAV9VR49_9PEZI